MNANLRFYKGLVDLLESHADEGPVFKRSDWIASETAVLSKILKKGDYRGRRRPSRKCELEVFCSVIHLSSAIVFLLTQQDLRTQLALDINFHQTSSLALKGFKRATDEKRPALVTVTDGTANILSHSSLHAWLFMEVPPVALKLASPERIEDFRAAALSRLQYIVADHPTDLNVFQQFTNEHLSRDGKPAELLLINEAPESIETLSKAKRDQVLLINPHMAHWAKASVKGLKPLRLLRGWQVVENRYIFGNSFFRDLIIANDLSWLFFYLKDRFENLRQQKSDFITNTHIEKEAFLKVVRADYFNF